MTYRSYADLGGQEGYGRINVEQNRPFDAVWEPQAMALTLAIAMTGIWNVDKSRSIMETLPDYSALGYYGRWIKSLERFTVEHRLLYPDEITAEQMLYPACLVKRVLRAHEVSAVLANSTSTQRTTETTARFGVGDRVCTRKSAVDHHTRLPAYAQGKTGLIERIHGVYVFPDAHSQEQGEQPQWLYTVAFSGRELWGEEGERHLTASIDAWEPYLTALERA